ncbi:MAG: ABC transporter permease [Clostridia bacterium]|nr:ABC transporter permease [Clostridia bacterium]
MSLKTIILKDLKIVLSDKKAFIILIAMPIILFVILSFALQGSFSEEDGGVWDIDVALVKLYDFEADYETMSKYVAIEDAEPLDTMIEDIFNDISFIQYDIMTLDKSKDALNKGDIAAVIVLPEHYVSDLLMSMSPTFRKPVTIEVLKSVDMTYSASIVETIMNQVSIQLSQGMIFNKVSQEVLSEYDVSDQVKQNVLDTLQDMGKSSTELKLDVSDYKIDQLKTINSSQYYSVAMMAMFLLFGASYGARFLLIERKKFTLQRQHVAGISPLKIIAGKLVLIFMIAVMQMVIMMITSILGFHVYWGNPISVVLFTILVGFAVTGFGTILASISMKMDSLKALNVLESGMFQVLALFGGSYFPLYLMPGWFQTISKTLLNGASLDGYHKIMMEAPIKDLIPSITSLIINGLGFMIIGIIIIRIENRSTRTKEIEVTS